MSQYRSTFVSQRSSVPGADGVELSGRVYSHMRARISGQRGSRFEGVSTVLSKFGIRVDQYVGMTERAGA